MVRWRAGSRAARAARAATVLPTPTSPVTTPRAFSVTAQVIRAAASPWPAWRARLAERRAAVADLDISQVEGVEDQLDPAAGQQFVDLVGVAVQGDRGGLGDSAELAPQERLPQLRRGRQRQRHAHAFLPAAQRR